MPNKKPRKRRSSASSAKKKAPDDPKFFNSFKSRRTLGLQDPNLSPEERKSKEEIFQRRREVAKLMTEYGYNDGTIASIIGVDRQTIGKDREWLHNLWLQEVVSDVDLAKAQLAKRKTFVLEEARMAWEKSKGDTIKKQTRQKNKSGGKQGGESESEVSETIENNVGNSEFLRLFAKAAEDLAELQGFKKDNITTQINITMPSLPSDFSQYGLKQGMNPEDEVEEAEIVEDKSSYGVDIDVLEEEEIRKRQSLKK